MRVGACILVVLCVCLGGAGCAMFKKSGSERSTVPIPSDNKGTAPAKFPSNADPILNSGNPTPATAVSAAPTGDGAILAGRVMVGDSPPPPNTFIRLVSVDQKEAQPTEVAVRPDGLFEIPNLKRGVNYKLLARGKNGERMLAGIAYTSAPNIRMYIQLKEELSGQGVPDVPGAPAYQGDKKADAAKPSSMERKPGVGEGALNSRPTGETELPAVTVPSPTSADSPGWNAGGSDNKDGNFPPLLNMTPPKKRPTPVLQIPDTPAATPALSEPVKPAPAVVNPAPAIAALPPASIGPARVPSCVKVGQQVVNFALNDIQGEPWEFRTSRKGQLVLLDFWWTECPPCLASLPDLRSLHQRFSGKGLEIIGIANEPGGTFHEQALRVQSVSSRYQVPYKQLLSGGVNCPLRTQLDVQRFPTLVLLDAQGWILWSHVGRMDASTQAELDRLIERRLSRP